MSIIEHRRSSLLIFAHVVIAAFVTVAALAPAWAQSATSQDTSTEYHSRGYLTSIDAKANSVAFTDSDARHVAVDVSRARILVPVLGNTPAEAGDLVVGMRVQIDGTLTGNAVRATRLQVLPYVPPSKSFSTSNGVVKPTGIRLQGTILAADTHGGVYTVHVGSHTRTVRVDELTLFQSAGGGDLAGESLRQGDLVRVYGTLLPNGIVDAAAMTLIPSAAASATNAVAAPVTDPQPVASPSATPTETDPGTSITGPVSSRARFLSRDIKIFVGDHEVKITVPHGIPIMRGDEGISVHDLNKDMRVTILGHYTDPDTFRADQIQVVSP